MIPLIIYLCLGVYFSWCLPYQGMRGYTHIWKHHGPAEAVWLWLLVVLTWPLVVWIAWRL